MAGAPIGGQRVHRRFQIIDRGDELSVLSGRTGKADDGDAAAGADLAVLDTVGGLVDNVDKCIGAGFQIIQGAPHHTSGTIQNQHDIGGMGHDIRFRRQRQLDLEGAAAGNAGCAQFFI